MMKGRTMRWEQLECLQKCGNEKKFCLGNIKERSSLEEVGIDGMVLKEIIKKSESWRHKLELSGLGFGPVMVSFVKKAMNIRVP
jgi:hypothetical protein